jgi:hypothetical protein
LLQHAELVKEAPRLNDLSILNSIYAHPDDSRRLAGRWEAGQLAVMRSVGGPSRHDRIPFGDLFVNRKLLQVIGFVNKSGPLSLIQNLSRLCHSRPLCLGASRCPRAAAYDTLMSPPLSSCGAARLEKSPTKMVFFVRCAILSVL